MSANLRRLASKLLKLGTLTKREIKNILKTAPKRLVTVLSEIAHNAKEGVIKVSRKITNSKVVKTLSDKRTTLRAKKQALRTVIAPLIVQALITAAFEILKHLTNG